MDLDTDATESRAGLGAGSIATISGLGVLLIFILQNRQPVTLRRRRRRRARRD